MNTCEIKDGQVDNKQHNNNTTDDAYNKTRHSPVTYQVSRTVSSTTFITFLERKSNYLCK